MRMVIAVIVLTAAGTGAGCPKRPPSPAGPAETTVDAASWDRPVPPTLDGTWTDGTTTLKLEATGGYWWQQPRPCKAAPCPLVATTGTYRDAGDRLELDPDDGGREVLRYRFVDSEIELTLARDGRTWTLRKQE